MFKDPPCLYRGYSNHLGGGFMLKFFSFKKKQKENKINSLIITKLDRIIELLEQQQKNSHEKNIHFDHVEIEHLENITFHLDNLEIDELSGKLVIGNHISTTKDLGEQLILKIDKENAKREATSDTSPQNDKKIIKTSTGYRFRNETE